MKDERKAPMPRIELRPGRGPGGPMGARLHAEKPKNAKKTLGRLLGYIGRSRFLLLWLIFIMVAVTLADLFGLGGKVLLIVKTDLHFCTPVYCKYDKKSI